MMEFLPYIPVVGVVFTILAAVVAATWVISRTVFKELERMRREAEEFRYQILKEIREARELSKQDYLEFREKSYQENLEFRKQSNQEFLEFKKESQQQFLEFKEESKQQFIEFREQTKEEATKLRKFVEVKFEEVNTLIAKNEEKNQQEHQQLKLSIDELANLIKNEHKNDN